MTPSIRFEKSIFALHAIAIGFCLLGTFACWKILSLEPWKIEQIDVALADHLELGSNDALLLANNLTQPIETAAQPLKIAQAAISSKLNIPTSITTETKLTSKTSTEIAPPVVPTNVSTETTTAPAKSIVVPVSDTVSEPANISLSEMLGRKVDPAEPSEKAPSTFLKSMIQLSE